MSEGLKHKIRRDLGRWSRKLLLCLGLESIGSELVGERNWRRLYPLSSDWERDKKTSQVSDFDPSGPTSFGFSAQDVFPDLAQDPSASYPQSDEETDDDEEHAEDRNGSYDNFAHLLPYWYLINRAFGAPPPSSLGLHGNISDDLNIRSDRAENPFAEALDAQQFNAFLLLHSLKQQQEQELQFQAQFAGYPDIPFMRVSNLQEFKDPRELVKSVQRAQRQRPSNFHSAFSILEEQPLDLTNRTKRDIPDKSIVKSGQLISPEVSSSNNGKHAANLERYSALTLKSSPRAGRGYTNMELEAALSDIQSGKLGTRRAAVIYGIPRSTLRNKVYKLGKDRPRTFRLKDKISGERVNDQSLGKAEIGPQFPISKGSAFCPVTKSGGLGGRQDVAGGNGDEVKSEEEISHEKKALKEWLQSKLSRQRLSAAEEADGIQYLGPAGSRVTKVDAVSNSSGDGSDDGSQDFVNGVPPSQDGSNDTPKRRLSLKRPFLGDEEQPSPTTSQPPNAASISPKENSAPDWKTLRANDDDASVDDDKSEKGQRDYDDGLDPESGNMSDGDGTEKKCRPKRGKYRNYDRDALVKAVKAVQNGEMSVHRAGSHFGVPHSTLEYKVKERHLLRRPTRKERSSSFQGNGSSKQKSSPESSLSESETGIAPPTQLHLSFSPVASTTRETLTRFLTEAASGLPRRRSSQGSPESGPLPRQPKVTGKEEPVSRNSSPSPFQLNDLLRRNADNSSLLNVTQKL